MSWEQDDCSGRNFNSSASNTMSTRTHEPMGIYRRILMNQGEL